MEHNSQDKIPASQMSGSPFIPVHPQAPQVVALIDNAATSLQYTANILLQVKQILAAGGIAPPVRMDQGELVKRVVKQKSPSWTSWTKRELELYVEGVQKYGDRYEMIAAHIGTRTARAVKNHSRLAKMESEGLHVAEKEDMDDKILEAKTDESIDDKDEKKERRKRKREGLEGQVKKLQAKPVVPVDDSPHILEGEKLKKKHRSKK